MAIIDELKQEYSNGNLVPFIGAGFSAPFKIPTWKELILQLTEKNIEEKTKFVRHAVNHNLETNDYWRALDDLMNFCSLSEQDVKEEIADLVINRKVDLKDDTLHNYKDLSEMNFKLYLTTNYDNLLQQYLKSDIEPISLKDIDFNTQKLFDHRRIFKLHGTTANPGSIVMTKNSYKKLYSDNKYNDLLKLITGNKKILFMGFSFDDQFIKTLINEHKELFNGNHYILLNNPNNEIVSELRNKYGLKTISYEIEGSSHPKEIRKILKSISSPQKKKNSINESKVLKGAGLTDLSKDLTGNLFYQKLKIENINEHLLELSSYFYIAADKYIGELKKNGNSIEFVDLILGQVFMEYQEVLSESYLEHSDSELFLKEVHKILKNIDYGRYKEIMQDNQTTHQENRGFIHVLADDYNENNKVWWGAKRFDESKT